MTVSPTPPVLIMATAALLCHGDRPKTAPDWRDTVRQQLRVLTLCIAALLFAHPAAADDANPLIGQWVDQLPNGAAMITEFTADTISFWAVNPAGAKSEANTAPITFETSPDGGVTIFISGQDDTPLTAVMRGADTVELVFPGMASRRLTRRPTE